MINERYLEEQSLLYRSDHDELTGQLNRILMPGLHNLITQMPPVVARPAPIEIRLPHPDYRPYNKAAKAVVYAAPTHAIYWKDDGDAVRI